MALSVTPTDEMKTLTVGEKIYEIVDDQAREDVSEVKADLSQLPTDGVTANAKQLLSSNGTDNTEPYTFRVVPVNADREKVSAVVGGTVAWNQAIPDASKDFTNSTTDAAEVFKVWIGGNANSQEFYRQNITATGIFACLVNATTNTSGLRIMHFGTAHDIIFYQKSNHALASGHKYLFACNFKGIDHTTVGGVVIEDMIFTDLTQMFGFTIADYIYSLETATPGAGVAFFRKYYPNDYYPYNAGTLKHVEGVSAHETVGFNQWDEEWELGGIDGTTGQNNTGNDRIRSKNYIHVFPSTSYYFCYTSTPNITFYVCQYDENKNFLVRNNVNGNNPYMLRSDCHYIRFFLYGNPGITVYGHDVCINIWNASKNGAYEPYDGHTYALDDSLTLRGIPTLVDGNIKFDGDIYAPSGKVTRRYGIVDLGTLTWARRAGTVSTSVFGFVGQTVSPTSIDTGGNVINNLLYSGGNYTVTFVNNIYRGTADNLTIAINRGAVYIRDDSYSDATAFKQAMSGHYLVYPLATPTTETATPYQSLQVCDPNGTEEFVSTGIVPVGHETRYPENLKAKIEGLPWDLSMIAPIETGATASQAYAVGKYFLLNYQLCKAKTAIASGATFTLNTNYEVTTVADELYTALHA